jgi:alpha-beta hydrolase superfamily lysophospholipase
VAARGWGRRRRRRFWRTTLLVAAALVVVLVVTVAVAWWVVEPRRPGDFYATPASLPARPGVLLRAEPVDTDVARADGYRVLYSSQDPRDRPVAVSGLVLVPRATPPATGYPVVAWAHGTSGVARRCAPSQRPQSTTRYVAGAQRLVDAGYLVVATDYPGLGTEGAHPYLVGDSEARAVLDSVRAVRGRDDWRAGSRVVVWGHSQGGHAALFASQRAATYAPELDLVGTAAAAPATELSVLLRHDLTEAVGKVFGAMALASWSRVFPDAELRKIVTGRNLPLVEAVAASCVETGSQALVLLPEVALMSRDFLAQDPTTTEPWATIIRDNTVAPRGIGVPLLVVQGDADQVIGPEVSEDWTRRVCRHHQAVSYREYPGADHLSVLPAATGDVVGWIGDRFAGRRPATCDHR